MNPIIKLILPQLLKYAADHKDEVLSQIQAQAYIFLKSIDADENGKPDIDESFADLQIVVDVAHRLFNRAQKLVARYGVKK